MVSRFQWSCYRMDCVLQGKVGNFLIIFKLYFIYINLYDNFNGEFMENEVLINNNIRNLLSVLSENNDFHEINIASAFFNYTNLIEKWLDENKNIKLLVSLRPTTDYYALDRILYKDKIEIKFLGKEFHSKLIVLLKDDNPYLSIIGSSNFTISGIEKNLETNLITKNNKITKDIKDRFTFLWGKGYSLESSDMKKYKLVYDKFISLNSSKESDDLLLEITKDRNKNPPKTIKKEAAEYKLYWNYVNQVCKIVNEISQIEYPNIPIYLTVDHFWHWIKTVWVKENSPLNKPDEKVIARMFKEYCCWDKTNNNSVFEHQKISKEIFKAYLSEETIMNLDKEKIKEIYSNLHSGKERSIRFRADEDFIKDNDINRIIHSFKYLLYSNDNIEIKISNLCDKNGEYKLHEMDISAVQELIGWVHTDKYPIRNKKSDDALEIIGYKFKNKNNSHSE